MSKKRLGKGIDALLGDSIPEEEIQASITEVPLEQIESDPGQPRKSFTDESLNELADSIRSRGVIQPIILEEVAGDRYRIVAGERRYRAASRAGLDSVPAIVRQFSEDEKYEIALIENIQREDLNPIEEAHGYETIMVWHGLTQDEIAQRLGKKRSTVANSIRLLKLSEEMQYALIHGQITPGHARALLSLTDESLRETLFRHCVDQSVSVREAERAAQSLQQNGSIESEQPGMVDNRPAQTSRKKRGGTEAEARKTPELRATEERLIESLGTKVVINGSEHSGKIEISYFSLEDLNRLLDLIG